MKIIQCENKHFFDVDENKVCPICGSAGSVSAAPTGKSTESSKSKQNGFKFWKKKKDEETSKEIIGEKEEHTVSPLLKNNSIETEEKNSYSSTEEKTYDDEKTSGVFNNESFLQNSLSEEDSDDTQDKTDGESELINIQNEIKAVSASSDGKTTGYFVSKRNAKSNNNSGYRDVSSDSSEPVVGWIVAVSGNHFGNCFNIYSGNNSIGRSEENRIVLSKDSSISRLNHAFIAFDPKKSSFFVRPGDSSGLVYVNDELVNNFSALKIYDILEIGETKLVFIPLCNESFSWENYINSES